MERILRVPSGHKLCRCGRWVHRAGISRHVSSNAHAKALAAIMSNYTHSQPASVNPARAESAVTSQRGPFAEPPPSPSIRSDRGRDRRSDEASGYSSTGTEMDEQSNAEPVYTPIDHMFYQNTYQSVAAEIMRQHEAYDIFSLQQFMAERFSQVPKEFHLACVYMVTHAAHIAAFEHILFEQARGSAGLPRDEKALRASNEKLTSWAVHLRSPYEARDMQIAVRRAEQAATREQHSQTLPSPSTEEVMSDWAAQMNISREQSDKEYEREAEDVRAQAMEGHQVEAPVFKPPTPVRLSQPRAVIRSPRVTERGASMSEAASCEEIEAQIYDAIGLALRTFEQSTAAGTDLTSPVQSPTSTTNLPDIKAQVITTRSQPHEKTTGLNGMAKAYARPFRMAGIGPLQGFVQRTLPPTVQQLDAPAGMGQQTMQVTKPQVELLTSVRQQATGVQPGRVDEPPSGSGGEEERPRSRAMEKGQSLAGSVTALSKPDGASYTSPPANELSRERQIRKLMEPIVRPEVKESQEAEVVLHPEGDSMSDVEPDDVPIAEARECLKQDVVERKDSCHGGQADRGVSGDHHPMESHVATKPLLSYCEPYRRTKSEYGSRRYDYHGEPERGTTLKYTSRMTRDLESESSHGRRQESESSHGRRQESESSHGRRSQAEAGSVNRGARTGRGEHGPDQRRPRHPRY